jgi:hypothetical protein
MKSTIKLLIWLKDGSIFKDWTLTQADIKVGGLAFDINTFSHGWSSSSTGTAKAEERRSYTTHFPAVASIAALHGAADRLRILHEC